MGKVVGMFLKTKTALIVKDYVKTGLDEGVANEVKKNIFLSLDNLRDEEIINMVLAVLVQSEVDKFGTKEY